VTGGWRKLHNEELHDLYSSPSIIRIIKSRSMRWVKHVARMEENRNAYRMLVGKPEGRRPLRRPTHRWVDNVRMDLVKVGWGVRHMNSDATVVYCFTTRNCCIVDINCWIKSILSMASISC
jgi:hypothetical protein